jgi:hypothetical protein
MPRDVTDADGTTWSCTPAYAGLATGGEPPDAARVDGADDCYWLVCTPSGGAPSVRVAVAADWEQALADDALLARIRAAAA